MSFVLEALPAKHGDCLLLHHGPPNEPQIVLVDGGPSGVWKEALASRLDLLRKARNIQEADALILDLVMVSHIDDDHIRGILDLTNLLCQRRDDRQPLPYRIDQICHNSFDDIVGTAAETLRQASATAVAGAGAGGAFATLKVGPPAAALIASVPQGRALRDNAAKLRIEVNRPARGAPLLAPQSGKLAIDLNSELALQVLGPSRQRLDNLHKEWDRILREKHLDQPEGQAAAAAFVDEFVFNLSSIVVLAEAEGKRILLTGDARGDDVFVALAEAGLINGGAHFEVLKVPHHGSNRNVAPEFFAKITADHYVISADGRHGNPEPDTIAMIVKSRRADARFVVHLTYPIAELRSGYPKQELVQVLQAGRAAVSGFEFREGDKNGIRIVLA